MSIPHRYESKQDIEISGLIAATLAWGQRKTIIKSSIAIMNLMSESPFEFISSASQKEINRLSSFKHRTFNGTDLVNFVYALRHIYREHDSLESVFFVHAKDPARRLENFRETMLNTFTDPRTNKHISSPLKGSACKRLNMFLRWMVRPTKPGGVDFGIWTKIPISSLVCPLDVHTGNTARKLGLLARTSNDWTAAMELTQKLKQLDPNDPVKYDFALFGLGVFERF